LIGEDDIIQVDELTEIAKEFIENPTNDPNKPEKKLKNVKLIGQRMVTENHVISVQTDRGTSYWIYFEVQDKLVKAYNELRDKLSKDEFGYKYEFLTAEQQEAVREVYPMKISEAEPKKYGKTL
jgi:hypothetical protein